MNIQNIQESCTRVQNNKHEPQTEEVGVIYRWVQGKETQGCEQVMVLDFNHCQRIW